MASFDNTISSNLTTKISPLIEGQVPDFVQSDHPLFVKFLKYYYEYLEAGELRVTVLIDDLLLELETASYVLDVDGNHIVLEDGTGTTGKFVINETITGSISKATAKVLVDDLGNVTNPRLFITSQQKFQTNETITGGTSNATATVTRYRANPIQNIQQLLSYADTDNTIYDFLDQLRYSFMNAIPTELASGVNKRNLIKNIRELYRAKGTSEGHKIFIRMLLDENADISYPNKHMLRVSDGKWDYKTIIRCSPGVNSIASEVIGKTLTGENIDGRVASAVIADATTTAEGGDAIVIFEINPDSLVGTFTDGETATAISSIQDISMSFIIRDMVADTTISNGGILYSEEDVINLDTNSSIGNGEAVVKVGTIKAGSVSDVVIDDIGSLYEVGDTLIFSIGQAKTKTAAAFVSVIDGSISMNGTEVLADNSLANENDNLILEDVTTSHLEFFNCILEGTDPARTNENSNLILNGTDGSFANVGHNILMEYSISQFTLDSYGTTSDTFVLEEGTALEENSGITPGEISRIFLQSGGVGYLSLPSITIASINGTGANLLATTTSIGAVDNVEITNQGFKYLSAPDMTFRANFVIKDVSGTFEDSNTLTTHTGTVKAYDSSNQILETTIEDASNVDFEGATITDSSGATATIVNANIAKGITIIGTKSVTVPSYGTSIESLISEDLIRIQDSYFYQAFSYVVETDSDSSSYLRELKKAVHPAGFAVFSKVSMSTAISVAISITGASLGDEYISDTDTFSPILASTFEVLFDEVMQRRLGVSGQSDPFDLSLSSIVTTEINIPLSAPRHLVNGLITVATDPFTGHTDGEVIRLEDDPLDSHSDPGVLLIDGFLQINRRGFVKTITSVGDEFKLEDGSNHNHLSGFIIDQFKNFSIEDIIRPSLVAMDLAELGSAKFGSKGGSTPTDHVNILLEGEEQGSFKQEDESIISGTYGDDLLLEDGVGVGFNNKLLLEFRRIQLEDGNTKGTIPFQNYTNSTVEPFTRPAYIYVSSN